MLMSSLQGDMYLNQLLGFVAEIPAGFFLGLAVDRLGRRIAFGYSLLEGAAMVCSSSKLFPFNFEG